MLFYCSFRLNLPSCKPMGHPLAELVSKPLPPPQNKGYPWSYPQVTHKEPEARHPVDNFCRRERTRVRAKGAPSSQHLTNTWPTQSQILDLDKRTVLVICTALVKLGTLYAYVNMSQKYFWTCPADLIHYRHMANGDTKATPNKETASCNMRST